MRKNFSLIILFFISFLGMLTSCIQIYENNISSKPIYNITYESAYGVKPQNISVTGGYILSDNDLPLLTESGWNFCGWNKNVGDVVNMDITITAIWAEWETVANPVITPESCEVSTGTTATISCNSNGATIYYTTDGSTPNNSSYIYSEPIPITSNMTIKAFAVMNNMKDSQVVSSSYTVPVVNNPVFNISSNVISPKTTVFITCATPEAIIYYTTNNENPSNLSTQYNKSKGIIISQNTTVKAIAIKAGMLNSEIVKKTYTIKTINGELQGTQQNSQYQGKVLINQSSTGVKTDEKGNLLVPVTNESGNTIVIPFTEEVVAIPKGTQAVITITEEKAACNSYQFSLSRKVKLGSFYISKYPVTRALYKAVMESNDPSDIIPKNNINWFEAIVFCNKLSIKMGLEPVYSYYGKTNPDDWFANTRDLSSSIPTQYNNVYDYIHYDNWKDDVKIDLTKNGYRLPTSAEWEYAARGGDPNAEDWLYTYSGSNDIEEVAWYSTNSGGIIHEVGTRTKDINSNAKPNKLGLFDMSGNIFEWCNDTTATNPTYPDADGYFVNPMITGKSYDRILRGGSFNKDSNYCGVISGISEQPAFIYQNFGLRLVRTAK